MTKRGNTKTSKTSKPQEKLQAHYQALVLRLAKLYQETVVEMNESDLALKEALAIGATEGIWGPRGWRPVK